MTLAFDVVGLGQCSLDFLGRLEQYPELDQKAELHELKVQGGGPVATALVCLARLGVPVAICGRVGDDDYGQRIIEGLVAEHVDCRALIPDTEQTSQAAFIVVDEDGHRNIFWHRGTAQTVELSMTDTALIRGARILHLDGLHLEAALAAARHARSHGVCTVLDAGTLRPGIEQLLPLIDHLVVSEKFARQVVDGHDPVLALETLLMYGAKAVTVTLGKRGSISRTAAGEEFGQPAFEVDAIDTTGCGDVFHGGYIFGLLQDWPLTQTVRFAAACAALKTRSLGGRTAIPTLVEVESFLSNTPG